MTDFVSVGRMDDFPAGRGKMVVVNGRQVAVFHLADGLHAIDNTCLHRGGPLCDGAIDRGVVTCPWHGWSFHIATGIMVQDPGVGVSRHDVRVTGDDVSVRLTD